jgi:hypothetical protein
MTEENPSGRPDKFSRGKRGPERSKFRKMCEEAGISRHQMYQMIQIANIPEDEFERLIESDDPPNITELAKIGRGEQSKPRPSPRDAAMRAIAKAIDATHSAYWAACDAEGQAIDPAALGAPDSLLDDAYEAALLVEGIAAERGISWTEARQFV